MGDKAILSEVLEASHLTDAYAELTAKQIIQELRHVRDEPSVRYTSMEGDKAELGEPEDAKQHEGQSKQFTVDDAVEALGFGRFQLKLSLLTGMAWMADAMEMMLLSLLSPALACEWGISPIQQALVTTCVFTGMMTSSTFWGKICDRFGRKTGLTFSALIGFSMGALSGFSPHFYVLLFLRGMTGFGIGGVPQSVTLYAEFLPTAQRAKCVVLIESFWAIGAVFEALLAFLVMETWGWRALIFLSSLPLGCFALCSVWLPESARFHMACGNKEKALETLMRVAKENRTQLPAGELVNSHSATETPPDNRGHISTLLSPQLRKTTLLLWFIWAVNAFSYYGMVLFTTVLFQSHDECHGGFFSNSTEIASCQPLTRGDYLDLLSTTMAEFPGLIITAIIIEWFGRKRTMAVEFAVFSVFTVLLFLCLDRFTVTVFIFVARAFISGAFQCAYVYTPEVYPTTLRAVGLGAASAMARVGAIVTPFVAQVASERSLNLPIGIYGTAAILGLIAALSLPIETKGRKMTLGNLKNLGTFKWDENATLLKIGTALQLLDIPHTLLKLSNTGIAPCLMQVIGRLTMVYIIEGNPSLHEADTTFVLLFAWILIELFRYPFYALKVLDHEPFVLTWLRYSAWIPLYPLGLSMEATTMIRSIGHYYNTVYYSMPNPFNISFNFGVFLAVFVTTAFPYIAFFLLNHMRRQRVKKLGGKKNE